MKLNEIAAKRQTIFVPVPGFGEELAAAIKAKPDIVEKFKTFKEFKKNFPPKRFPGEHKLSRKLSEFSECHLASNVLLYFIHKDDTVYLLSVDTHNPFRTGKTEKVFQQKLRNRKISIKSENPNA
ncbi:MAG: hypothetical protein ACREAU_11240 [Nitrosopumilaceae archaeon]